MKSLLTHVLLELSSGGILSGGHWNGGILSGGGGGGGGVVLGGYCLGAYCPDTFCYCPRDLDIRQNPNCKYAASCQTDINGLFSIVGIHNNPD